MNVDSDKIEEIRCLCESDGDNALMSNLGNLSKSRNQKVFIDRHLKVHLELIDAAKMPTTGLSIMADIDDDALSFKDLLTI